MSSEIYDQLIHLLAKEKEEHERTRAELEYTKTMLQSYVEEAAKTHGRFQQADLDVPPQVHLWTDKAAILGQKMDDTMRALYTAVVTTYCDRVLRRGSLESVHPILEIFAHPPSTNLTNTMLKNFATLLDSFFNKTNKDIKTFLVSGLPIDIPCSDALELFIIDETDRRVSLRGRRGVRARKPLKEGTFLGVYRGTAMLHSTFKKWKISSSPPTTNPIAYELMIDSYTASTTVYNVGKWALEHGIQSPIISRTKPNENTLDVSAAGEGNILSYINDPHIDPLGDSIESLAENAAMCEVTLAGWPFLVMFATRAIATGEEILYSYGDAFWEYVEEHTLRLKHWLAV